MIQYPLQFQVRALSTAGMATPWDASTPESQVLCAIPPEFQGPGGGASPEDLYALSLLNCFIATFKVLAERSKLTFSSIHGEANLTVDRDENGTPWMSSVDLRISLQGAGQLDRAQRLLEKTRQMGMILNSVRSEIRYSFQVEEAT